MQNGENVINCDILRVIDDVSSIVVMLRPQNAKAGAKYANIRMDLPKDAWSALSPKNAVSVKIVPSDILLLR
jgi:hypothetical protein